MEVWSWCRLSHGRQCIDYIACLISFVCDCWGASFNIFFWKSGWSAAINAPSSFWERSTWGIVKVLNWRLAPIHLDTARIKTDNTINLTLVWQLSVLTCTSSRYGCYAGHFLQPLYGILNFHHSQNNIWSLMLDSLLPSSSILRHASFNLQPVTVSAVWVGCCITGNGTVGDMPTETPLGLWIEKPKPAQ